MSDLTNFADLLLELRELPDSDSIAIPGVFGISTSANSAWDMSGGADIKMSAKISNVKFNGLSCLEVVKVDYDPETHALNIGLTVPGASISADFKLSGTVHIRGYNRKLKDWVTLHKEGSWTIKGPQDRDYAHIGLVLNFSGFENIENLEDLQSSAEFPTLPATLARLGFCGNLQGYQDLFANLGIEEADLRWVRQAPLEDNLNVALNEKLNSAVKAALVSVIVSHLQVYKEKTPNEGITEVADQGQEQSDLSLAEEGDGGSSKRVEAASAPAQNGGNTAIREIGRRLMTSASNVKESILSLDTTYTPDGMRMEIVTKKIIDFKYETVD